MPNHDAILIPYSWLSRPYASHGLKKAITLLNPNQTDIARIGTLNRRRVFCPHAPCEFVTNEASSAIAFFEAQQRDASPFDFSTRR